MVNIYVEKNNKVYEYYDVSPTLARMIMRTLDSVEDIPKVETLDGHRVEVKQIDEEQK